MILRRVNTGTLAISTRNAKTIAPRSDSPTTINGRAAMANPQYASVEAIERSVAEETTSQKLGRVDHRRLRVRFAYIVALLPNTMSKKARVLSVSIPRPRWNLPRASAMVQNNSSEKPMNAPAMVRLPTRHALGVVEGRTLSVVRLMPRKSPVIMIMTLSIGVRIARPVMIKPAPRKRTWTIFFVTEFRV